MAVRTAPEPGTAPLPAPSVGALLRRNAEVRGERPFILFEEEVVSHRGYLERCCRWAHLLEGLRPEGPFHVGVLLENLPAYLEVLGGAALVGATVVGLNPTRQGAQLLRDLRHTDVGIVVTQPRYVPLLEEVRGELPSERLLTVTAYATAEEGDGLLGRPAEELLAAQPAVDPQRDPPLETTWCLIFTSGTTSDPKAVICSQRRLLVTGERMRQLLEVTADDVGYVAMPLFHSNALMVGFAPALVAGAAVGLARRFTASGFLRDVRRYGATWFNYTGKPLSYILATPERPDDADNPLRRAFGNEGSPWAVREFARRFGCEVIDLFGPTEGAIGIIPDPDTPPGAVGRAGPHIRVVDAEGRPRPPAEFDAEGRLVNAEECVGEIVNTAGVGPFEGYYNDPEATAAATRFGWYWSGDLGYIDRDGFLYFAGRTDDWVRVDGENFPVGPIEQALSAHPDVVVCAVYGVPDAEAGDQVMAALVLREGARFDPEGFARYVDGREDLPPKWRPRYVRVARNLPQTATGKILTRLLRQQKFRHDRVGGDELWVRERGADRYRPFTVSDEAELRERFAANDRLRWWDL